MKRILIAIVLAALVLFGAAFGCNGIAAENAREAHLWLMQTLLPGSTDFTRIPYTGEDGNIRSVHEGETGFVVETVTYGYAGEITMSIGVSRDGKVTGLVVEEAHETFGLGNQILTDHEFLAQFLNGSGSFEVETAGPDAFSGATGTAEAEGEAAGVDAITGATVSSKAVVRCVNSAIAYVTGADAASGATTWGG